MKTFGSIIKKLRQEKQLPLRTVAAFLDIDQAILSKIENGQRKISRDQVVKLSEYFKVAENDLILPWLADKVIYEIGNEEFAMSALHLAEDKVKYNQIRKNHPSDIDDKSRISELVRNYLLNHKAISKAWLFGSFVRDYDQGYNDIDIMIRVKENVKFSLFDLADIQYQLEQITNRKIDLVEEGELEPYALKTAQKDLKAIV